MKFPLALLLGALIMASTPAPAALVTRSIPYKDGDTALTGYLAYDDTVKTPAPGVLVIHEWWGLTDYAKKRTEQIARLGYVAFALDMYGDGAQALTPDEAKKLSAPFYEDRNVMRRRALAGLDVLKAQPQVNGDKLGVIGYCFGGSAALELARMGADVKGVVSFHGGLTTTMPAEPGAVKAQVLALNGGADPMSPPKDKTAFNAEMRAAGVTYHSVDYPGALHAFTNPAATAIGKEFKMPVAYDADADAKSWSEMKSFFTRLFRTTR